MKYIVILTLSFLSVSAHAFGYDGKNPPYTIAQDYCKKDIPLDKQTADCQRYLQAPEDIAQMIDLTLECWNLSMLIQERQDLKDKKGEADWQKIFNQKECESIDSKRLQLLNTYWLKDMLLEGKAEFLDDLIRLPKALYWPGSPDYHFKPYLQQSPPRKPE
jgi:hypothetical protein